MARRETVSVLDRTVEVPPASVLIAIREHAGYWEESLVPPELRARGVFGVNVTIKDDTFTLVAEDMGRDPSVVPYPLYGNVASTPSGGTRIQASTEQPGGYPAAGPVLALLGVAGALVGAWLLAAVCVVLALLASWFLGPSSVPRGATDPGVLHLVARLNGAIDSAITSASRAI